MTVPIKFCTRVLGVDAKDVARAIQEVRDASVGARALYTQWFFGWLDEHGKRWLSLRSSAGNTGRLAVSTLHGPGIGGTREVVSWVSDVDDTLRILSELGHDYVSVVVMFRSLFRLGKARIALDEPPGVPPWLEITGPDAATVVEAATRLGYPPDRHARLSVIQAYRCHGIDILSTEASS